jgi:hypothetical protein
MLMNMGGLVPLPSDALATPVTFRVRRRNLRGILAPFDAAETGFRELSGEWVVGKKTWQRLQSEWKISSTSLPERAPTSNRERVVLYIHGGMDAFPGSANPIVKCVHRGILSLKRRSAAINIYSPGQVRGRQNIW